MANIVPDRHHSSPPSNPLLCSRVHTYTLFKGGRSSRTTTAPNGSRVRTSRGTYDTSFSAGMILRQIYHLYSLWALVWAINLVGNDGDPPPPTKLGKPGRWLVAAIVWRQNLGKAVRKCTRILCDMYVSRLVVAKVPSTH